MEDLKKRLKQTLSTAHNIRRFFTGALKDSEFEEQWTNHQPTETDIKALRKEISQALNRWFWKTEKTDSRVIVETLQAIKQSEKLHTFLRACRDLARPQFKYYFDLSNQAMPTVFARPSVFFPIRERFHSEERLVRRYGEGHVEMRGLMLKNYDFKTLCALVFLNKQKPRKIIDGAFIKFDTSLNEIAGAMQSSNPSAQTVRDAVWYSLERLRGFSITWIGGKGMERSLGGVLAQAHELSNQKGTVTIYLHKQFVDWMTEKGFASLDLEKVFTLPDREAVIYYFLMCAKAFNTFGKLGPMNVFKFHQYTGQSGIGEKTAYQARREVKESMQTLLEHGIIKDFKMENDRITISTREDLTKTKSKSKITARRSECPHGYKFGEDNYKYYPECRTCEVEEACEEASF